MRTPNNLGTLQISLLVLTLALGIAISSSPAFAQDDEPEFDAVGILEDANQDAQRRRYAGAIEKFTKVIQHDARSYPNAYYNLGELLRFKKKCVEATLMYTRFLEMSPQDKERKKIEKYISECQKSFARPGKVTVRVNGSPDAVISLNGLPFSVNAETPITLPAGRYRIRVKAPDFEMFSGNIEVLEKDNKDLDINLKAMSYFGTLAVKVNIAGASISIDGKNLGTTPLDEPIKLSSGKHFVEVSKDGYHRWIRNVIVARDDAQVLNITLQKSGK